MNNVKYKILFVCIHNSARSQMAEAFLNDLGASAFEAESAGLEPGSLNPNVVQVMVEAGIDISGNQTKAVFDLTQQAKAYHAVITVCDAASAERCPVFPGKVKRIAWSFDDPSGFTGSKAEILEQTRKVRDVIKEKVTDFIEEASSVRFWI
ncbi:arsenate reductase ArsC [Arachidicoccus sp.]|uniref:arsenate reductase ArsC n=1 Tax=Arachidicoccus sp. TaxID=1872624 RepID=UPI003D2301D1